MSENKDGWLGFTRFDEDIFILMQPQSIFSQYRLCLLPAEYTPKNTLIASRSPFRERQCHHKKIIFQHCYNNQQA